MTLILLILGLGILILGAEWLVNGSSAIARKAGVSEFVIGVTIVGFGKLTPQILANFYNIANKRTTGNRQVVATFKGVGGRYNSFQNNPKLLPLVDRSLVKSTEFYTEDRIMAFPFQTEVSLQEWHFKAGVPYRSASEIILKLMQNVSRNGSLLLNITQRGRGDIDPEARQICEEIGLWLKTNAEAVYGSRPFDVWGDEHLFFTRNNGNIYVTMIDWDGNKTMIEPLKSGAPSVGKISDVTILGSDAKITFLQTEEGLAVSADTDPAEKFKVLKVVHDKRWFNDDDPGVSTIGWTRECNRDKGDFNNDLYITDHLGDVWQASFTGRKVTLIAPTGIGWGSMRIQIDGKDYGTISLKADEDKPQQSVFTRRIGKGSHVIRVICQSGTAAIDALKIK